MTATLSQAAANEKQQLGPGGHIIAAFDIGTNSIHLVVAAVNSRGHVKILDTDKVTVRLGQHVNARGEIDRDGIRKTVATMKQMLEICAAWPCHIRAIATHAVRESANHAELIEAVFKATGIRIEVIDGHEEARLVFLGMRQGLPLERRPVLALDIGGGSTEILFGRDDRISHVSSLKLGAVTLAVQHDLLRKPSAADLEKLREDIALRVDAALVEGAGQRFKVAVASSGTAKALASINPRTMRVRSGGDLNGQILRVPDLEHVTSGLRRMRDPQKIRTETGLDGSRSEIILAGAELLLAMSRGFGVAQWWISTWGLREGIVIDTWRRLEPGRQMPGGDTRAESVQAFAERFAVEPFQVRNLNRLALRIFDQCASHMLGHFSAEDRRHLRDLLGYGMSVLESGRFISPQAFHRHSQYLVTNSRMLGFTRDELCFIGLIARYHRKSVPPLHPDPGLDTDLAPDEWQAMRVLSGIARLSAALNRTRRGRVKDVVVRRRKGQLQISVVTAGKRGAGQILKLDLQKAAKEIPALEKSWGVRISLD
jgi:exopolyphosphatase/guanosine-5'-triphosphate,3'-diphosphate pyrophosphatase